MLLSVRMLRQIARHRCPCVRQITGIAIGESPFFAPCQMFFSSHISPLRVESIPVEIPRSRALVDPLLKCLQRIVAFVEPVLIQKKIYDSDQPFPSPSFYPIGELLGERGFERVGGDVLGLDGVVMPLGAREVVGHEKSSSNVQSVSHCLPHLGHSTTSMSGFLWQQSTTRPMWRSQCESHKLGSSSAWRE